MITGIGIDTNVAFAPGNAGPFDISLGFHPPNGVGLEVDGGGFAGGGFLVLDAAKGEYSGGLDLMFEDTIAIRAIGILTTKMPDGGEGFSLLILIATDFPPIQLSFGFTLNGIGGLLGLNRGLDLDVLHGGLRDGSLGSILFPMDVVANAARIISDLGRVFPPQRGLLPLRADGQARLGHADARHAGARRDARPAATDRRDRRHPARRPARGRRPDPQAPGQLRRRRRLRRRPACVRRHALRLARPRLHAHRRHGGARVLEGEREPAADGGRLPSRLHAAADESAGARAPGDRAIRGQSRRRARRRISP